MKLLDNINAFYTRAAHAYLRPSARPGKMAGEGGPKGVRGAAARGVVARESATQGAATADGAAARGAAAPSAAAHGPAPRDAAAHGAATQSDAATVAAAPAVASATASFEGNAQGSPATGSANATAASDWWKYATAVLAARNARRYVWYAPPWHTLSSLLARR
eukprot:1194850-Prorocentrum_minimum.AAC.8